MGPSGGHTCSNKQKVKRGLWSPDEDEKLFKYITSHGHGRWSSVPSLAGLQRNGRSCRLRWINYLRPDLKRGKFTSQEATLIVGLHRMLGNRWAQIATYLPGRTDNCIKNFFYSKIRKKLLAHAHSDLSSNHLVTTFPDHKTTNIHDTSPNVICLNQPHIIHDQDHHARESPMATSQPHMINHDKCIDIDPTPDLPPLPQSFIVNSSSMFDNQFPTMEHLNSCDANILKPENYDLMFGQHLDHNPSIIPFKLGDQITNVDMTANTVLQVINSHDLSPSRSSQTDYLETFVQNIPSSSSSPPLSLVLPQFMDKKVNIPSLRLPPNEIDLCQPWWVDCKEYFDGLATDVPPVLQKTCVALNRFSQDVAPDGTSEPVTSGEREHLLQQYHISLTTKQNEFEALIQHDQYTLNSTTDFVGQQATPFDSDTIHDAYKVKVGDYLGHTLFINKQMCEPSLNVAHIFDDVYIPQPPNPAFEPMYIPQPRTTTADMPDVGGDIARFIPQDQSTSHSTPGFVGQESTPFHSDTLRDTYGIDM